MKVILIWLITVNLTISQPFPPLAHVNLSLDAIYKNYDGKIKFRIHKPSISVFDVYIEDRSFVDEKGQRAPLYDINFEDRGQLRTIKAITAKKQTDQANGIDEMLLKLERGKNLYYHFNPEIDKQAVSEVYYLSKEPCNDQECYFIIEDYYSNDLKHYYDDHCVDNIEELLEIFVNMADDISSLHRKHIVHCNIALKEFLIRPDGLGYFVSNFGIVDDDDVCKTSDSGFAFPKSALNGLSLKTNWDLILKQDVYALGFAFLELINKNTLDSTANPILNAETLNQDEINKIFDTFGCFCVPHYSLDKDKQRYLQLIDHVFKNQLKILINSMITKNINDIPNASVIYDKLVHFSSLYKKLNHRDIFRDCAGQTPEECVKAVLTANLSRGDRKLI